MNLTKSLLTDEEFRIATGNVCSKVLKAAISEQSCLANVNTSKGIIGSMSVAGVIAALAIIFNGCIVIHNLDRKKEMHNLVEWLWNCLESPAASKLFQQIQDNEED